MENLGRALILEERDVRVLLDSNRERYASEIAAERAASLDTARGAMANLSTSLARVGGLDSAVRRLVGGKVGTGDPVTKVARRGARLSQVLAAASAALEGLSGEDGDDAAA